MDWTLANRLNDTGFLQFPRCHSAANLNNPQEITTIPTLRQLVVVRKGALIALLNRAKSARFYYQFIAP